MTRAYIAKGIYGCLAYLEVDDMDDDYLTDAVLAQDFGTELHDWTK